MKVEITMPKMGESITEGTLIKWHKKVGESVKKDEIIYEISTDKVDTEIPSPEDGILSEIKVLEQETVEVGTVVALIETNGSASSAKGNIEIQKEEPPSTTQVGGELIDIPMPKMGESIMEGTIIKWHKKVGDAVKRDEIIFEISTDKVDTEVPSPADGIIEQILFNENDIVQVGVSVAKLRTTSGLVRAKQEKDYDKDKEQEKVVENVSSVKIKSDFGKTNDVSKFFSPLVLNIARKENISIQELETINGSGINGRVTKNDILKYINDKKEGKNISPAKIDPQKDESNKINFKEGEREQRIPMDNIRQRIMHHMVNSRDTSVHVTAVTEVDMTKIYNFINLNKEKILQREGIKLTYMSFITFAVTRALKEFALMNASLDGQTIVAKKYINIGIAVAVEPNGLIVPNIKNADKKNIIELTKAIADLGNRARTKKLVPDDVVDGTFSITNFGVFGSLIGTPIINQPEVGILGVGAVTKKPVVVENNGVDSIAIKPMMYLSLSHDHRLVDGMLGGKFLMFIKNTLENFDTNIV